MKEQYEQLVQQLFGSGLVRIDAFECANFANLLDPVIQRRITLTHKQLDCKLIEKTTLRLTNIFAAKFAGKALEQKVGDTIGYFRRQLAKKIALDEQKELELIRILAQATQPIVLHWLLLEEVEVFISYGDSIGDVMDVVSWQQSGQNSGMQSTDGVNVAVFVSCGGNPLGATDQNHPTYGDGLPAIARMQIVAAQELGHYSDIKRDSKGRQIGRHSANFSCTRPAFDVHIARMNDIASTNSLQQKLISMGLRQLFEMESSLKFYNDNKIYNSKVLLLQLKLAVASLFFSYKMQQQKLFFGATLKTHRYPWLMMDALIGDMLFNLNPQADVYERENADEREAIKCAEALARVPQQVMKWGHLTTKTMMPGLYDIYYGKVIPSLIKAYHDFSNYTPQDLKN